MVLPQAMAWVQYWFRILSLKFCGKTKKICGDISPQSPAFCMYAFGKGDSNVHNAWWIFDHFTQFLIFCPELWNACVVSPQCQMLAQKKVFNRKCLLTPIFLELREPEINKLDIIDTIKTMERKPKKKRSRVGRRSRGLFEGIAASKRRHFYLCW